MKKKNFVSMIMGTIGGVLFALVVMNQALAGIVFYIVKQNRGFTYSGTLIYAMAAYTFYITISAAVNVARFRKHGSPLLSAAKAISLTAALVSMLSLETAMLAQFGAETPRFRLVMTAASGSFAPHGGSRVCGRTARNNSNSFGE